MGEGNSGKAVGGAALGAGGILAAILKSGSAEVHMAETGMKAAAAGGALEHAGVVGAKGLGAGAGALERGGVAGVRGMGTLENAGLRGAGALEGSGSRVIVGAGAMAEHGTSAERAMLYSASDLALTPVASHGGEVAAGGTKVVGGGGTIAKAEKSAFVSKSVRTSKVHDVLEHAVDAKDLIERLGDVWDLAQGSVDDEEDERVTQAFEAKGLDFRKDVVPAFKREKWDGFDGASRELLTDGHGVIPSLKLAAYPSDAHVLGSQERTAAVQKVMLKDASVALYASSLEGAGIPSPVSGTLLLLHLSSNKLLTWRELPTHASAALPAVMTIGDRHFAAVVPVPNGASVKRVFVVEPKDP